MRNIQKNLVPKWDSSNKISDLIQELPHLCNNFEYQLEQGLLPDLGEYFINSYVYDINDFFRNGNNKCFKILVPNKNEEENKTYFYERYFVVTSITFIILESVNERYKNICRINYVGDLSQIDNIDRFINTEEEYKDLSCFQIKWNKNYTNQLTIPMCGNSKTLVIKNLCDCLEKRKEKMKNTFKIIQKDENGDVKMLEKILSIKEKLVEDKINDFIYEEINNLYQKIIELLSIKNNEDFKKYLGKLQNFINKYDKLKNKANSNSKETSKGKNK